MKLRPAIQVTVAVMFAALAGCASVKTGFIVVDVPEIDEGVENALTRVEMRDGRGDRGITFESERGKTKITVQPSIPLALGIRLGDRLEHSPRVFLSRLNKTALQISVTVRVSRGVVDETGATGVVVAADASPKGGSVSDQQLYYGSASFTAAVPVDALDREQVRLAIEAALDELADEIFRGFVRDASPDLVPDADKPGRHSPARPGLTS